MYRYRVDTHANGETTLIRDRANAAMVIRIDNDVADRGQFDIVSSVTIDITDETIHKGKIHSKTWDDLKAKQLTHRIHVDPETHKITFTPRS